MIDNRKNPKLAYPWLCIACGKTFRGRDKLGHEIDNINWVCVQCWQKAKQKTFEWVTQKGNSSTDNY